MSETATTEHQLAVARDALNSANERADRWKARYDEMSKQVNDLNETALQISANYDAVHKDWENERRKVARVETLVAQQWRVVPVEVIPDTAVEAFSAGRNWMIDKIREAIA